jgi:hypothetical protein
MVLMVEMLSCDGMTGSSLQQLGCVIPRDLGEMTCAGVTTLTLLVDSFIQQEQY